MTRHSPSYAAPLENHNQKCLDTGIKKEVITHVPVRTGRLVYANGHSSEKEPLDAQLNCKD